MILLWKQPTQKCRKLSRISFLLTIRKRLNGYCPGNKNKGKGNDAGLAWESHVHWFADRFLIIHAHSFGTDPQHDYSQERRRTMSSIIINIEFNEYFIVHFNQIIFFAWNWINKCTLLDCTNIEIRMYCQSYSTRLRFGITYTHSFGTDTHTWRFRPLLYMWIPY